MKKLRLLSLILVLLMILTTLVGCRSALDESVSTGNSPSTQDTMSIETSDTVATTESNLDVDVSDKGFITTKDAFVNKVAELLDVSFYSDLTESDNTSFKIYYYQVKPENEQEYDLDYKIKLGDGSEFTMPITFSELEKKGWILQESSDPDREIESGFMTFGTVENASGKTLSVAAYNPTDKTIAFKECTVINVDSQQYSTFDSTEKLSDAIDFTVCDSLTNASTLEDIVEVLGNPYSISCTLRYDGEGKYTNSEITVTYMQKSSAYSQIEFELSGDGDYITCVSYDVKPE